MAIDRENDGGVELLKWLLCQPNVELLLGNHEAMHLSCEFIFREITDENIDALDSEKWQLYLNYTSNGGDITLKNLRSLLHTDPETLSDILDYLKAAPLYETVSVGGRDFLLVHAGLRDFNPDKIPEDYTPDGLLWTRPHPDDRYYEDIITVFGHTPTAYYGAEHRGKILKTPTWIDIDVGVSSGFPPALLRLDDLQEFYLESNHNHPSNGWFAQGL